MKTKAIATGIVIASILYIIVLVKFFGDISDYNMYSKLSDGFSSVGIVEKQEEKSFYSELDHHCYYGNCNNIATVSYDLKVFGKKTSAKIVNSSNNEANIEIMTNSYTSSETHRIPKKNTYLVEQSDGDWKVEDRWDTEERVDTSSEVYAECIGYYCSEHKDVALTLLRKQLKSAFMYSDPCYYLGIILIAVPVVAFPTVIFLKLVKDRKARTLAASNSKNDDDDNFDDI